MLDKKNIDLIIDNNIDSNIEDKKDNKNNNIYYDGGNLLSRHKILNIIISSRGTGKSYFYKSYVIKKSIKSIEKSLRKNNNILNENEIDKFIIFRRFKNDIKIDNIKRFMDDLIDLFDNYDITIKNKGVFIKDKNGYIKEPIEIGTFYAISEQDSMKSTPHPRVKYTIFDEAIIDQTTTLGRRYLKDEPRKYMEALSTISRNRWTQNFIIGNNIRLYEFPYIEYFDIKIDFLNVFKKEFYNSESNSEVVMQVYQSKEEFKNKAINEGFGKFASQVKQYSNYLINGEDMNPDKDNINIVNNKDLYKSMNQNLRYLAAFRVDGYEFGAWIDNDSKFILFKDSAGGRDSGYKYAINSDDKDNIYIDKILIKQTSIPQKIKIYFNHDLIYYQNRKIFNKAQQALLYIL